MKNRDYLIMVQEDFNQPMMFDSAHDTMAGAYMELLACRAKAKIIHRDLPHNRIPEYCIMIQVDL